MRARHWAFAGISLAVVAAGLTYYGWRIAGREEVRAATERVAAALARGDQEALTNEPFFQDKPDMAAWLMQYRPHLERGYRVVVKRNGADGYTLMSRDVVTHVGFIETPSQEIRLGFHYDRKADQLKFVVASSQSPWPPR
jgi:hypothetical protein